MMRVNQQFIALGIAVSLFFASGASACQYLQQPALSVQQAKDEAAAVFIGEVVSVEKGQPSDYVSDEKDMTPQQREYLAKNSYQLHLNVDHAWKGIDKPDAIIFMVAGGNTCGMTPEGDEMLRLLKGKQLIFAEKNGNYLTLPIMATDRLSAWGHQPIKDDKGTITPKMNETIKQLGKPLVDFRK